MGIVAPNDAHQDYVINHEACRHLPYTGGRLQTCRYSQDQRLQG